MPNGRIHTGDVVDGFTIGELAHTGGMARLWSVSRPDIDFPLLMKIPMLGEGDDPAAIVSFEMEQLILPRLSGPHVPRFVGSGDFSSLPHIVMERVPGASLATLSDRLPLPPDEVARHGANVAIALDALHRQHVVHLDIKPANVLMRETGEAVLIDYGLARHNLLPDLMQEEFRLPYGTAPYMAPEQVLGRRHDYRSDIFALGSMLYFFATGEHPFGDPQRLGGLKRRLWRDPWPPRARNGAIPHVLQEVILRCLEVNPAWRHLTAAELAADLQDLSRVKLTARASRMKRDPYLEVIRRRFNPVPIETLNQQPDTAQKGDPRMVLVALDLGAAASATAGPLRRAVTSIVDGMPGARIACVNVLRINRVAIDTSLDDEGRNKRVLRLAELNAWAAPLKARGGPITFHVLEAVSPADAILEFARQNRVDQIVMGARGESRMRSMLGSVSGAVAAHAPCTVTVVRQRFETDGQAPADKVPIPGSAPPVTTE
ncbi:nucleotide-binding universal stress UspA family protein [Mycoplana sp. BE70]|uniref:serine/threonine protein kinase n=1 Tax=Mycoplana sp. BE70 TaxID=2817775 RepID=UPI00285C5836|nr:bifunctional serine/threonine-protein kinase/universal stress protein [Mycoplana sp. BE70]MDR6758253.1 nucleotide-binding universal stress UspA family protein [Mycoplana sp. BE70]